MRRLLSAILVILMVCSVSLSGFAQQNDELMQEALARVSGLGVIKGDEGGFRLEDSITRAEFTTILCRLMNMDNITVCDSGFDDVTADHWASGYVATAKSTGLVNGVGNNLFAPEANVTFPEVLKMMVSLLGYGELAEAKGGWPNGYTAQAGSLGLTKGVDMNAETADRGAIVVIIDNALDVKPLEPDYGKDGSSVVSKDTLYDRISNRADTVEFEGIYQENEMQSILNAVPFCEEGIIIIEGREYKANDLYDDMFGKSVKGVAREYKNNKYEIVSIYAVESENNVTAFNSDDGELDPAQDYGIVYEDNGKEKKTKISSSATYLYNGRLIGKNDTLVRNASDADYILIDNTGDKTADIVMIEEGESFAVDRYIASTGTAYFKTGETFRQRRSISLIPDETKDNSYVFVSDKDGNPVSVSDIAKDCVLTIFASSDLSLCNIKVSFEIAEGTVDSIDEEGMVTINGNEYKSLVDSIAVGDEGRFAIDVYGRIASKLEGNVNLAYGYIINAGTKGNLDTTLILEMITAGPAVKNVTVEDGVEEVSYYFQNNDPLVFTCDTKIKFANNDTTGFGKSVLSSSITKDELIDKMCAYRINGDGEITHLNVYDADTFYSCKLNADKLLFGGQAATRGFSTDEDTKVICIPRTVRNVDDYGVRVQLSDGGTYNVNGVKAISEYAPNTTEYRSEAMDIVIVKIDMNSSVGVLVTGSEDICIVGRVSQVLNEEEEEVVKIDALNGDKRIKLMTREAGSGYEVAKSLSMGDLIRYTVNADGTINNLKKLASVQGLGDSYADGSTSTFGICESVLYDTYDNILNDIIDEIVVSIDDNPNNNKTLKIVNDEHMRIYHYNRRLGTISYALTDDIISIEQSNTPSKVFAMKEENDVVAVVIIDD